MSRNMMVLFLLVAVVCATAMSHRPLPTPKRHPTTTPRPLPPPKCPKNEIYKRCGTRCPPSCKNPKPICNKMCVAGCFCKDGQLRNKWGKCVEPCDC